jgi:hypothetical protein
MALKAEFSRVFRLGLTLALVVDRLKDLLTVRRPVYDLRWRYYRNPLFPGGADGADMTRPYTQGQEYGLPKRITGFAPGGGGRDPQVERKEVVIENDIAWRVDTRVQFLFGKPVLIRSAAPGTDQRRAEITSVIRGMMAANGGMLYWQNYDLYAEVFGFADSLVQPLDQHPRADSLRLPPLHVKLGELADLPVGFADMGDEPPESALDEAATQKQMELRALGALIRFNLVEPSRAMPFCDPSDYRRVLCYGEVYDGPLLGSEATSWLAAFGRWLLWRGEAPSRRACMIDLYGAEEWQRYQDGVLVASGANLLGAIPLVHMVHGNHPFVYAGPGAVEPLIPLQDDLNTRLSDRGHRVTMQAHKMFLAKGMQDTGDQLIGPSRVWYTDNSAASVTEFGGDFEAPSELAHISDIREAGDKISGASPIAAGAIKNRLGALTSAVALRMTLISLLSQSVGRRSGGGDAIQAHVELGLRWLDVLGLFKTSPAERRVALSWPSPLPENKTEELNDATLKKDLGVPLAVVLRELGYAAPTGAKGTDDADTEESRPPDAGLAGVNAISGRPATASASSAGD